MLRLLPLLLPFIVFLLASGAYAQYSVGLAEETETGDNGNTGSSAGAAKGTSLKASVSVGSNSGSNSGSSSTSSSSSTTDGSSGAGTVSTNTSVTGKSSMKSCGTSSVNAGISLGSSNASSAGSTGAGASGNVGATGAVRPAGSPTGVAGVGGPVGRGFGVLTAGPVPRPLPPPLAPPPPPVTSNQADPVNRLGGAFATALKPTQTAQAPGLIIPFNGTPKAPTGATAVNVNAPTVLDPRNPEVQELSAKGLEKVDNETESMYQRALIKVIQAQKVVGTGIKYYIEFVAGETNCTKDGLPGVDTLCQVNYEKGTFVQCRVEIWKQPSSNIERVANKGCWQVTKDVALSGTTTSRRQ